MITATKPNGPKANTPIPAAQPRSNAPANIRHENWLERIEQNARAYCRHVENPSWDNLLFYVRKVLHIDRLTGEEMERVEVVLRQTPRPTRVVDHPVWTQL